MSDVKVADLKKGQVVYECEGGVNIKLTCQEDARKDPEWDGMSCRCLTDKGDEVNLFQTNDERVHHYGPRLYNTPQYIGGINL